MIAPRIAPPLARIHGWIRAPDIRDRDVTGAAFHIKPAPILGAIADPTDYARFDPPHGFGGGVGRLMQCANIAGPDQRGR